MILFSCGRLVRSSCSPLVYFESVRSGRLVLLYYMLKLSSAKCHHFWSSHILSSRPHYINAHNKLQHAWHLLKELQDSTKGFTGRQYWIRISSALQRKSHLFLCFHACQILNIIKMNMRMGAREEYCGTIHWLTNLAWWRMAYLIHPSRCLL